MDWYFVRPAHEGYEESMRDFFRRQDEQIARAEAAQKELHRQADAQLTSIMRSAGFDRAS